jgi:hypothetical protein
VNLKRKNEDLRYSNDNISLTVNVLMIPNGSRHLTLNEVADI